MKRILFLALALWAVDLKAAIYYVSSSTGNDANSTSLAQSSSTPWKSGTGVTNHMASFVAGDIILFKRGETFTGSLNITKSGTVSAPITFDAYGSGNSPILSGFSTVGTWTNLGSGIFESSVTSGGGTVNAVTIGGVNYAMGRTPNTGYNTYESGNSTSITDNDVTFPTTWASGGKIVIKTTHSNIDITNITAISGKTISFSSSNFQAGVKSSGYGYFLENSFNSLDQFGEWYYNPNTHKLDVFFGATAPGTTVVQLSTTDVLVTMQASNITMQNLTFTGANTYTMFDNNGGFSNIKILGCKFKNAGIDHIYLYAKTNLIIDNCTFDDANSSAISVNYHNDNTTISNCTITNSGIFPGMAIPDGNNRAGYGIFSGQVIARGLTATNNVIKNCGYIGIYFDGSSNLIQNNYVDNALMNMDDGAGIYVDNFATSFAGAATQSNNFILNNVVLNCKGDARGTPDGVAYAHAFYFDDYTNHIVLQGNTGANCGYAGVFVHNTYYYTVRDNVFYNNGTGQFYLQDDNVGYIISNGDIKNNQAYSTTSAQKLIYMQSEGNTSVSSGNYASYATWDSNYYAEPFGTNIAYTNTFGVAENNYTFTSWKSTFSQDAHTSLPPFPITGTTVVKFVYNETKDNKDVALDGNYLSLTNIAYTTGVITLSPYSSAILIRTGATTGGGTGGAIGGGFYIYGKKIVFQ